MDFQNTSLNWIMLNIDRLYPSPLLAQMRTPLIAHICHRAVYISFLSGCHLFIGNTLLKPFKFEY